jgi:hypothetical protein
MKPKKKAATRRNAFTYDNISSGKIEEEETNAAETPDVAGSIEYLTQSGTPLPKDLINGKLKLSQNVSTCLSLCACMALFLLQSCKCSSKCERMSSIDTRIDTKL